MDDVLPRLVCFNQSKKVVAYLKAIIVVLPELIGFIKGIASMIRKGSAMAKLKMDLKAINNAFEEKDSKKRARKLNNIFK